MNKKAYVKARVVTDTFGCWIWCGTVLSVGYGRVHWAGQIHMAHRFSLHAWRGFDLRSSAFVCHKCHNPLCVNPKHLYAGTPSTNAFDSIEVGKWADNRGERSGLAKLTDMDAAVIRSRYCSGERQIDMAKEYGVHANTIWRIVNKITYEVEPT